MAGKYRLLRVIGTGGMGVVCSAEHLELRQQVAIKFLHGEMAKKPEIVRRFLREGQAAARLRSEHVARVIDASRTDDGQPFLVMELLEGIDLGQKLRRDGPMPVAEAAGYVIQTCAAIGEAHGLGIVHRDLKPANLFLTRRPDGSPLVKVVDFGISKIVEMEGMSGESTLTTGDDVLGSPLYMAPEQIRSPHGVDGRADLWSLGAILHRLVSNKSAFAAPHHEGYPPPSAAAVLAAIIADEPTPLREHAPGASVELEAIVARCLTRDLNLRWQTAAQLADALRPLAPGAHGIHVPGTVAADAQSEVSRPGPVAGPFLDPGASPVAVYGATPANGPSEPTTIAGGSVSTVEHAPGRRLPLPVAIGGAIALIATGVGLSWVVRGVGGGDAPRPAAASSRVEGERGLEPSRTRPADTEPVRAQLDDPGGPPPAPSASSAPSAPAASASAPPRGVAPRARPPSGGPSRPGPDPLDDRQ